MTAEKTFFQTVGRFIEDRVQKAVAPLRAEIEELKIARSNFRYCGTWDANTEYRLGNFVSHDGSLWHANITTNNRPGRDPVAWTLCCKRGQDGKDRAA